MCLLFGVFPACLFSFFFPVRFFKPLTSDPNVKKILRGHREHACLFAPLYVCGGVVQIFNFRSKYWKYTRTATHTHTHTHTHPFAPTRTLSLSHTHTHTQQVSHTINEYQFGGSVLQHTAIHCNTLQHCGSVLQHRYSGGSVSVHDCVC